MSAIAPEVDKRFQERANFFAKYVPTRSLSSGERAVLYKINWEQRVIDENSVANKRETYHSHRTESVAKTYLGNVALQSTISERQGGASDFKSSICEGSICVGDGGETGRAVG
jgi:hypothetical protein